MPRAKSPSPLGGRPEVNFSLDTLAIKRLASLLGRDSLIDLEINVLNEILTINLTSRKWLKKQKVKTTRANLIAALNKLLVDIRPFSDEKISGMDAETFEKLSPAIHQVEKIVNSRIVELKAHPRIIQENEMLRNTCPQLRIFFDHAAACNLKGDRPSLRKFVFEALSSANIWSGIDEAHLDRLDDYLNAKY